jgi:hypothetical protein
VGALGFLSVGGAWWLWCGCVVARSVASEAPPLRRRPKRKDCGGRREALGAFSWPVDCTSGTASRLSFAWVLFVWLWVNMAPPR